MRQLPGTCLIVALRDVILGRVGQIGSSDLGQ